MRILLSAGSTWAILVVALIIVAIIVLFVWRKRRNKKSMEHVVYIHINSHKVLPNLGVRFDPLFEVQAKMQPLREHEFHHTYFKLKVSHREVASEGLYGNHIECLTAIVGNNGAGKTSALRFLLKAVVSGSGHDISGFVVTEMDDHSLNIYHSEDVRVEVDAPGIQVRQQRDWPEIDTFLYSGHVNILTSADDIMTTELQGMVNATEGYLITADLMNYGRELSTNGQFSLRDYATAYNYQNQWRVCNFLSQYDGPLKELLDLPEYVLLLPNTAGQWSMMHRLNDQERVEYPRLEHAKEWTFREFRLAELIYYSMVNYISDGLGERSKWEGYIDSWNQTITEQYAGDIVVLFRQFIDSLQLQKHDSYRNLLEYIYEVVGQVNSHCQFDERSLFHYFYFRVDDESMKVFLGWLQGNQTFLASRYFDLHYAHDIDDYSILSSGEKAMLDMYSRIYDTVIYKHQRNSNHIWPTLFIFDEAEIGFHPEWQRSFVKNITLFLDDMARLATDLYCKYHHDAPEFRYQVVITSHSPIILSDIPSECAVMLRKVKDVERRTENVSGSRQQTFGTNIFELYRDSFFLEGGLVGEFATEYIDALDKAIDDGSKPKEELKKSVMMIGDRVVRDYLMGKLYAEDKEGLKDYYRKVLQDLEDEQN